MGSKRNWLVEKARGPARAFARMLRGRDHFGIDLTAGGVAFTCDLDDAALSQYEVRRWRDAMGEYYQYKVPRGEQLVAKGLTPFDIGALSHGENRPRFLVFSVRHPLPYVDRACALVIHARAGDRAGLLVYECRLRDPRPMIVGISEETERVDLLLRLTGRGTIPRIAVSVFALTEWDHADDAAVRGALAAGLPTDEVDWIARLPAENGAPLVAGALAAQSWALAGRMRDAAAQLMLVARQAEDLRRLAPDANLADFAAKAEEAAGYAMHAEALASDADRRMRRAAAELSPEMVTDDAPLGYDGARSGEMWRRRIVEAALVARAEHGMLAGLALLWRYADPTDYRRMLDAFAEALSATEPELARECVMLGLAFDPSERRLRQIARRLFQWGQLAPAGELIADVANLPDSKAIGELRFALGLRRELETLLTARGAAPLPHPEGGIAYVASSALPEVVSGYTTRTQSLLSALAATGERVTCHTRPGFPWDRDGAPPDAEFAEEVRVGPIDYVRSPAPPVQADPDGHMRASADALIAHFRADPPMIVHAASNYRNALPALIAARAVGAAFIYEVRGFWELSTASRTAGWEETERFAFERDMEHFVVNEADLVLTITEAVRAELLPNLREGARARVLSNGVDPERFRPMPRDEALAAELGIEQGDITLVYAGSLVEYEGLDDVIAAIGLLRERDVPARLIIVGDGRCRAALERQVAEAGLGDRVRLTGRVDPDDVLAYLALADIVPIVRKRRRVCELVSPLKPFEAMAMEKVVIASDLPALAEIVEDGTRGRLCRPEDPAHLAALVEELHADPALRATLGRAAREWVIAERSWTAHARELVEIYREIRAGGEN